MTKQTKQGEREEDFNNESFVGVLAELIYQVDSQINN